MNNLIRATKKGQAGLIGVAMSLVVAGALVAVGALVLAEIKTDITASDPDTATALNGTTAENSTIQAQEGLGTVTSRFGIVATIAVMGVLLALVYRFANFG